MLLIDASVRPSPIHGSGLFSDQFISKGALIWRYSPQNSPPEDLLKVDKVNHSAAFNVNINFRAEKNIEDGDELTIFYPDFNLPLDFLEKPDRI
jgi:SET domain-containing protein